MLLFLCVLAISIQDTGTGVKAVESAVLGSGQWNRLFHRNMPVRMLTLSVNIIGEYGELDQELSEPYKQEFEDISDVLEQAGLPRFKEPDTAIQWGAADDQRKYHERIPVHSLHLLRRAYTAMKTVNCLLRSFCVDA